jgi:hypothetical protein
MNAVSVGLSVTYWIFFRWKALDNVYRKVWGVNAIPTLIRYQRVDGEVTETGRLVEAEVIDEKKFLSFVSK